MPARSYYDRIRSRLLGRIDIVGSFAPNGSSAISAASNKGKGFSVARTSAGVFTVTFDDVYPILISAVATIQMASATDVVAQIGTYTAASRTLVISALAVATATDIAANANNRIHFAVSFSDSSLDA